MEHTEKFCISYTGKDDEKLRALLQIYGVPSDAVPAVNGTAVFEIDARLTKRAKTVFYIILTVGILLFAAGMHLTFLFGRPVIGFTLTGVGGLTALGAYPIHTYALKAFRKKAAPEIISLGGIE